MANLNHPPIIKRYRISHLDFADDPNPVIILEYMPNCSVDRVTEQLEKGTVPIFCSQTKYAVIKNATKLFFSFMALI